MIKNKDDGGFFDDDDHDDDEENDTYLENDTNEKRDLENIVNRVHDETKDTKCPKSKFAILGYFLYFIMLRCYLFVRNYKHYTNHRQSFYYDGYRLKLAESISIT